jgi:hypothetical protein
VSRSGYDADSYEFRKGGKPPSRDSQILHEVTAKTDGGEQKSRIVAVARGEK